MHSRALTGSGSLGRDTVEDVAPRVTLQTIADRVGVSRMTVSNAFSKPDQLSPAMRQRILEAAKELGYVGPDPAARALARGTAGAVGVLFTDSISFAFSDEISTGFLGAIADVLGPTGLALTLLTTPERQDVVPARDVPLDGALIYACNLDSPGTEWLKRRKVPLVLVDQEPDGEHVSVNIDDREGARLAARHLIALGHRRFGILNSSMVGTSGLLPNPRAARTGYVSGIRLAGWLDALEAAGITPTVVQERSYSTESHRTGAGLLLDQVPRPTAIIAFSDVAAENVVAVARERGLRVPEDLSVVGFDDSPLARRMTPPLTTVRQDVEEKGRVAASALTRLIGVTAPGEVLPPEPPESVLLPVELVVRGSTAPPPPDDGDDPRDGA
jgi:DNA-binding LacI/PurR family transcriptional regulator